MSTDLAALPWSRFQDLARDLAELDVELGEDPRPRLAGYRGDALLAVIDLRPFPPGGIEAPMVEAVAGLLALGVDRFATALPGRAWSLQDPIAPVSEHGDLRQRVLMLTTARPDTPVRSWLWPFDLTDGALAWHTATLEDEPCEGWVPYALGVAVEAGWDPDPDASATQLARCTNLGHDVLLTPAGLDLLGTPDEPSSGQVWGR